MFQFFLLALSLSPAVVKGQIAEPTPEPIYGFPSYDGSLSHDGFQMTNGTGGQSRIGLQVLGRLAIRQDDVCEVGTFRACDDPIYPCCYNDYPICCDMPGANNCCPPNAYCVTTISQGTICCSSDHVGCPKEGGCCPGGTTCCGKWCCPAGIECTTDSTGEPGCSNDVSSSLSALSASSVSSASLASVTAEQEAKKAKKKRDTTIGVAVGVSLGVVALAGVFLGICLCKLQKKRTDAQAAQVNQTQTIASSQAPLRSHATSPTSAAFSQHSHHTNSWYGGQPPATMPPWATGINPNISTTDTTNGHPSPPPQVQTWVSRPNMAATHLGPPYIPMGPGGTSVPQVY